MGQQIPFTSGSSADGRLSRLMVPGGRRGDRPERDPNQLRGAAAVLRGFRGQFPSQTFDNAYAQVDAFKGVIFTAIKPISSLFASSTYSAVRRTRRNRHKSTFGPNGAFAKALPAAHQHARDDEYVPLDDPDHPLAKLLERPNRTETFGGLARKLAEQYLLTGIAPMWVVPSRAGKPVELWALKTPTTVPVAAQAHLYPDGAWRVTPHFAAGWSYGLVGGRIGAAGAILPGNEVARFMDPHPLVEGTGYSRLTAAGVELDVLQAIQRSRKSWMDQGVSLNAVVVVPGMDQDMCDRLEAKMTQKHAGADNAGKVAVIAPPAGSMGGDKADVKTLSAGAGDLGHVEGWEQLAKFCTAVFGTPPAIIGFAAVTSYSELYAARQQFHDSQKETLHSFGEWLTRTLAWPWERFPGEFKVQVDMPGIDDKDMLEKQLAADAGIRSVNERRALRNIPPIEGGDVPEQIYLKVLEQKLVPQPQAPAPGSPGGAAPPGDPSAAQPAADSAPADPLAGLLGAGEQGDERPGDQQADGAPSDDGEEGTRDAATRAALAALGLDADEADDGSAPVTKAAVPVTKPGKRREGEKWRAASGRLMTIRNGRAVPAKADDADPDSEADRVAWDAGSPKSAAPWAPRPDATGVPMGGVQAPEPTDRAPKPPPVPAQHYDTLAAKLLKGRPGLNLLGPDMKPHKVTDGKSLQAFFSKGGRLPESAFAPHAAGVPAATPAAKSALERAHEWADTQAAKHAERVAAHFGITPDKARALLAHAIKRIAHHALQSGGAATGTLKLGGKQLKLGVNQKQQAQAAQPRTGPTSGAVPRPANPQAAGSRPPTVKKGVRPEVAELIAALSGGEVVA